MWFDPVYFLFLSPALVLMIIAQAMVQGRFRKYSQVGTSSGLTGAEVAREILRANGILNVKVEEVSGFLSDHYDPISRTLRLSPGVYHGRSQAAVGIAAHECGHAIQHAQGYALLALRSALVPAVQVGSWIWMPLLFLGFFLGTMNLIMLGIVAFSAIVVFQLITLPVEFDASRRALVQIQQLGIVRGNEVVGARKVLTAAALTYVAAALQSVLTLLYFLMRAGLLGGRRD
ncbi:MAG: zinc metallopeptidase [Candidatus Poribacteria bacterium]|nr:MAG: zinc metallopeptidase [Candidatus Poribacteria bacterium]